MAEESRTKLIPTDEVVDAKIVAALEEPLRKLSEHEKSLAGKAESSSVYDKTTVDSKVKAIGDTISEHVANNTRHITDSERETWNNKPDSSEIYTRQQSDHRFSHVSHEHTNDGWFISAINAVKTLIPTLPLWLTPTREEPPTKNEVESKYTKPSGGIPLSDIEPSTFPPTAHSHASDNWFTAEINSKADEAKPSFSTITINGVDYTEWTLGTRSGKIVLSVDMGGISTEIAAFNPVTGVFGSAPSQYRNTLRFDGEAPVVGASPTLFDHVARESALSGKADISHTHTKSEITDFPVPVIPSTEADDSEFASAKKVAEFVNSSINNLAAYYLTYNAQGDAFPTKTALDAATTFYNGGVARSPTKNDYLIVLADEEHTTALGVNPTTRYVYDGAQWAFQYVVNNTSLTQAQVDAINSGITALLVNWLAAFKGSDTSTTLASVLSELSNKLSLTDGDLLISGGHIEVNDTIYANGAIYKVGGRELGFNIDSGRSGNIAVDADFSPTNPAPYVSALFNDSNTYLTGVIDARLPYPIYAAPSTGLLKDRAINTTSLASVTVPNDFTDLLIRASVASSLAVTMPDAITTKYGDTFPAAAGEYLITITKTGAAEAYVRTIKMEVANA